MLTGEKARQEDGGGAKASGRNIIINTPASLSIIVASLESIKVNNFYVEPVMSELVLYDAPIFKPTCSISLLSFFVKKHEGVDIRLLKI